MILNADRLASYNRGLFAAVLMRLGRSVLILLYGLLFCSSLLLAQSKISIAGTRIEGIFDEQVSGPHNQIFREIMVGYSGNYSLEMYPVRRAVRSFIGRENDCIFIGNNKPEYYQLYNIDFDDIIYSQPFNSLEQKLYTLKSQPIIEAWADIEGITVSAETGTAQNFREIGTKTAQTHILPTSNLEGAFMLLDQGRVGAVAAFSWDAALFFSRMPKVHQKNYHASVSFVTTSIDEVLSCWKTEQTKVFIEHVNKRIQEMIKDRSLMKILYVETLK